MFFREPLKHLCSTNMLIVDFTPARSTFSIIFFAHSTFKNIRKVERSRLVIFFRSHTNGQCPRVVIEEYYCKKHIWFIAHNSSNGRLPAILVVWKVSGRFPSQFVCIDFTTHFELCVIKHDEWIESHTSLLDGVKSLNYALKILLMHENSCAMRSRMGISGNTLESVE